MFYTLRINAACLRVGRPFLFGIFIFRSHPTLVVLIGDRKRYLGNLKIGRMIITNVSVDKNKTKQAPKFFNATARVSQLENQLFESQVTSQISKKKQSKELTRSPPLLFRRSRSKVLNSSFKDPKKLQEHYSGITREKFPG